MNLGCQFAVPSFLNENRLSEIWTQDLLNYANSEKILWFKCNPKIPFSAVTAQLGSTLLKFVKVPKGNFKIN